MRVVADASVYLSALLFGGPPEEISSLAREGGFELLVSSSILLELATVLKTKFEWNEEDVADAIRSVGYCSEMIKPGIVIKEVADDADNRILECAVEGGADFVVSGNRHLLTLGSFRGIRIVRARELLDLLAET